MDKKKLIQDKLILQLDHHLTGLKEKIMQDFSKKSFEQEVASLKSDPIYPKFNLSSEEYALIRLMGRVSISIGRRLGEIYDKIPRLIAQKAFNISEERIAPKMGGKLELDTCLPFDAISDLDKRHIENTVSSFTKKKYSNGAGIEVRYNFNPNDSSRLRKDVDMVNYLIKEDLAPIYLVFSSISPRDEAIARLQRAGWIFIIGRDAVKFSKKLYGIDLSSILEQESIKENIKKKIDEIMRALFSSYAFMQVVKKY